MKFFQTLFAITLIQSVLGAPLQDLSVSVSSSGPYDLMCKSLSLYGGSSSGISVVEDESRGWSWVHPDGSTAALQVANTALGFSYTKALWVKLDGWRFYEYPQFMDSAYPSTYNETNGHYFGVGDRGDLYAGHNVGSSQSTRWGCNDRYPSGVDNYLPFNQWIHVAVTYDGDSGLFTFYRNGTQSGGPCGRDPSGNTTPNISKTNWKGSPLNTIIGSSYGINTQINTLQYYPLRGRVQDVQQYSIALTAAHIQQIAQQPPPV